jgi:hypothetical protein
MNQRRRALVNPLFDLIAFGGFFAVGFLFVQAWLDAGGAAFTLDGIYRAYRDVHREAPYFYPIALIAGSALLFRPGTGDKRLG